MTQAPARKRGRPAKNKEIEPKKLLEHAFYMFASEGFDGTSLRKLAAEIGIDYTLYRHYFGSKEALWKASLEQELEPHICHLNTIIQKYQEEQNAQHTLRLSMHAFLTLAATYPDKPRLLFREIGNAEREVWLYERFAEPLLSSFDTLFIAEQQAGRMRAQNLESIHAMIIGVVHMVVTPGIMATRMTPIINDKNKLKDYINAAVDQLFDGLFYMGDCKK